MPIQANINGINKSINSPPPICINNTYKNSKDVKVNINGAWKDIYKKAYHYLEARSAPVNYTFKNGGDASFAVQVYTAYYKYDDSVGSIRIYDTNEGISLPNSDAYIKIDNKIQSLNLNLYYYPKIIIQKNTIVEIKGKDNVYTFVEGTVNTPNGFIQYDFYTKVIFIKMKYWDGEYEY